MCTHGFYIQRDKGGDVHLYSQFFKKLRLKDDFTQAFAASLERQAYQLCFSKNIVEERV